MTDDLLPQPAPDELLEDEARALAHLPPEWIPDAEGLPDEVRDGRIDDVGEDDPAAIDEPITLEDPE